MQPSASTDIQTSTFCSENDRVETVDHICNFKAIPQDMTRDEILLLVFTFLS